MHLKKKRYMYEERDDYSSVDNNSNTNSSSSGSNSSSSKQVICQKNCTLSNMADNTREVRIEEQLKVKIGEAKNLVSRNAANSSCSTQGFRDVYCTIALDQEEICRTPTKERTLSPFFGEEFQFKIPRRFRYLSVYVYDRDRHMKQDKPIGKIAIKREELYNYNHNDHWFPLRPVNANSEVQGMVHIQVEFEEVLHPHGHHHHHHQTSSHSLANHMQQQQQQHHHPPHHSHSSDTHHPRINLIRPAEFERNSDMILDYSPHQHQAQHNDYKENSELSSIQRGLLKNNRSGAGGGGGIGGGGGGGTMSSSGSGSLLLRPSASASEPNWKNVMGPAAKHSRVAIRVLECVDLAKKSGTCDPYVEFTAHYTNMRPITKRTKTRKKTVNPEFDEVMHFDLTIDADPASVAASPASAKGGDEPASASLGGGGSTAPNSPAANKGYSVYPLGGVDLCEITVTLWHDAPGIAEKVFLGEVKIPLRNKQQQAAVQPSAWYFLQPRPTDSSGRALGATPRSCATPPGTRLSCDSTIGSLRLKLLYTADHVFPLATYDDLMNLLLESADQRPITVSAVSILGELVSCKTDVAQPLVRLFMHTGRIAPIIKALADHEISNLTDPTTIFRGNTLVSKMMDETMRLSGLHYLHQTLRPVMAQILAEKKPCEIDPSKVKDRSAVDTNLHHLQDYVERVFEAITKSAVRCPRVLCHIFHDLRECAARHFPRNREVRYSVVSGFIFLRFFAPAILGPKLFDLTTEPLDCQTNRTLTLISKTIQSLGNLVSSRSSQQPCKEEYTGQLYLKFCTEKHVEAVKHFLEVISTTPNDDGRQPHGDANSLMPVAEGQLEPVLLKEGMMTKWPQSRKRFGRRQFKHRYFRLTTHSLSYAKSKGKQPICDIPLSDIERVEQLNEKNFKRQNCFKIVRKDRSVIVQTTNCVEEREWIDLLHKICLTNSIRMQYFHPSAFVNGVYSCCARSDENAPGCKNVSAEAMDYFQMDLVTALDPALDLQRIHTLIMSHMNHLKDMLEPMAFHQHQQMIGGGGGGGGGMNTSSSNNNSHYQHSPLMATALAFQQHSPKAFNDFQATIQQLRQVALVIDKDHRDYKEGIARELKYGSRQAPIGDDNYLHMMRAAGHLNYQQQHHSQQQQQQQQHLLQHHQQQSQQQQQQQSQTQQQILPQMQLVMAYPYQPLQQQQMLKAAAGQQDVAPAQQQQHHSNMNAYFMHSLRSQQRGSQQQQQYQQAQQQHLLRASATVHSAATANAVAGNPSG